MKKQIINKLPWSTRKRLHYLEFKIFWEGRANRGDLTEAFEISIPQASADIARYQEIAPGNIIYDAKGKYYIPSEEFVPYFIQPTADSYFSEISLFFDDCHAPSIDNYFGYLPKPSRIIDSSILKEVVQAVRNKQKINIDYRSFNNPQPGKPRWITPHAFGFDGLRWHVRAYCHNDNKFKDYVIGRIVSIFDKADTDVDIHTDEKWFNFFDVIIGPNPKLIDAQKNIVAMEYGMTDQKLTIRCRISLLYYLANMLGVKKKDDDLPGEQRQLVALNKDEIYAAIES